MPLDKQHVNIMNTLVEFVTGHCELMKNNRDTALKILCIDVAATVETKRKTNEP